MVTKTTPQNNCDVAVIGTGPVGLFSIFQCGMLGMSCYGIDQLPYIGGQCTALYPKKPIFDIPAHPYILAEDLIKRLEEQAQPFTPVYHLEQKVLNATKDPDGFILSTNMNVKLRARAVILAAGNGVIQPKKPPIPNISSFEGSSVFYHVEDPNLFRGKKIAIAGGGDSALDWALQLSSYAAHVYLIHRRSTFRGAEHTVRAIHEASSQGAITLITPYQLSTIDGNNGFINRLNVISLDGTVKSLDVDVLLPFFGLSSNISELMSWGLTLERNRIPVNPLTMETAQEGVYAIGDIVTYPHKQKLIANGFAEGIQASYHIRQYLNPGKHFHFAYSTTQGVPRESKN